MRGMFVQWAPGCSRARHHESRNSHNRPSWPTMRGKSDAVGARALAGAALTGAKETAAPKRKGFHYDSNRAAKEKLARQSFELRAIVARAKNDNNRGLTSASRRSSTRSRRNTRRSKAQIKPPSAWTRLRTICAGLIPIASLPCWAMKSTARKLRSRIGGCTARPFPLSASWRRGAQPGAAPVHAARFVGKQIGSIKAAQTITTTGGGYLIPQGFPTCWRKLAEMVRRASLASAASSPRRPEIRFPGRP